MGKHARNRSAALVVVRKKAMRTFTIVLFFLLTLMVDNAFSQREGKSLDLSKIKGGSKSHMKAMGIYGDSPEMILLKLSLIHI